MDNLKEINCKEIFRNAYEKRYTWNTDFKGYKGKCTYLFDKNSYEGEFSLGEDFKPEIKNIDDEKIRKNIASQLFEVCIHRVKREFNSVHSENNFNFLKSSDMGIEMKVSGKNDGDKYRVKDEFINIGKKDYWILNSRLIKYENQNQEEEIQKFVLEDLSLLK